MLQKHEKARQEHVNADEVDENFIRLYWEQMLQVGAYLCRTVQARSGMEAIAVTAMRSRPGGMVMVAGIGGAH